MTPLEEIIEDPVVKMLIIVVLAVGIFDAFKFALSWVWRKIKGDGGE